MGKHIQGFEGVHGGNEIGKTNVEDFWSFMIKKWLGFFKGRAKIGKKHMEKIMNEENERQEMVEIDGSTRTS